ncbi:MAG: VOC family protein [Novosphingobium sp.]|nr:VOC family protein [Novosphingobium sp.]
MTVQLNHTIIWASDKMRSAAFLSEMFDLPEPQDVFRFRVVQTANGVSMDYADKQGKIASQHYAFLVSEDEFDAVMARIKQRGLTYWADPARQQEGAINTRFGGRGVYFEDPDGHLLEALTAPYSEDNPA